METFEYVQDEKFLKELRNRKIKKGLGFAGNHLIILLFLAWILVPLYIIVITSLKTKAETAGDIFYWWPQKGFTLEAYKKVFTTKIVEKNLWGGFLVTLWLYIPPIVVGVVVSAMAAYGFAKMEFIGKNTIFAVLMSSLTLPNSVGLIAAIVMYNTLGWMGTPLPIMIPRMMGSIGIVFFLRQFYMGLPDDLIGAARVDGLGDYGIFLRVGLPLSLPAIGSQFILTFIGAYNDYITPLYYMVGQAEMYPLQLRLAYWRTDSTPDWSILMAGAVTATIPMVFLYLLSQKFILKGVSITSGLKG